MKKLFVLFILLYSLNIGVIAQDATMPTIMVFPDDVWMNANGFTSEIESDGVKREWLMYDKAFKDNLEMSTAIQTVQAILNDYRFQCKDLMSYLEVGTDNTSLQSMLNESRILGISFNNKDFMMQKAGADIRVDLNYDVRKMGPRKSISYVLKAVDPYSHEQIAFCQGSVEPTMEPVDLAIRKAIASKADDFCHQIIDYFLDLRSNGRKITIFFRADDSSGIDFLNDKVGSTNIDYNDMLFDVLKKHAVGFAVSKGRITKTFCEFKDVRIPFFDEDGNSIVAVDWAKGVRKAFEEAGLKIKIGSSLGVSYINLLVMK